MPDNSARTAPKSSARRPRRSSTEVRELVLGAALHTFADEGFAGATTREIARRAGVLESTMFRIFPTKDALYEAAVAEPFDAFMSRFTQEWMAAPVPGGEPEVVLRQYVVGVRDLVRDNRPLIAAVNADSASHPSLQTAFARLEEVGEAISVHYGLDFDVAVAVRIATLTVVATSMLEESVFPASAGFTGDRVIDELVRMLVGATLHRPSST